MEKISLAELKEIIVSHLKKELDIMEMMLTLDGSETKEFCEWYINHPYKKGIKEIQELVKRGKRD